MTTSPEERIELVTSYPEPDDEPETTFEQAAAVAELADHAAAGDVHAKRKLEELGYSLASRSAARFAPREERSYFFALPPSSLEDVLGIFEGRA